MSCAVNRPFSHNQLRKSVNTRNSRYQAYSDMKFFKAMRFQIDMEARIRSQDNQWDLWHWGRVFYEVKRQRVCQGQWYLSAHMAAMRTEPKLKLVIVTWHCLHHVTFVYTTWPRVMPCVNKWLLCVLNLKLILVMWHFNHVTFMLCKRKVDWVNDVILSVWCLYHVLYVNKYGGYKH
jgi:hypothetical protein